MKIFPRLALIIWVWMVWWVPSASAQLIGPTITQISIRFVGPPNVSEDFIRANIRLKAGEPFTRPAADQDTVTLYQTGYFFKIQILADDHAGGVSLTYVVQGKPILADLKIIGNVHMSLKKVKKKVTSKVNQTLDERKLFDDALSIKELYEKAGYEKTTVEVLPPVVDEAAGRGSATIVIHESAKVKIKNVVFENVGTNFTQHALRKVLKNTRRRWMFSWLTGSGVLKEDGFDEDKDTLVDFYQNNGFIDFAIMDVNKEYINPKWMVLHIKVSEGKQYKVGTVDIKGNTIFTTNDFFHGTNINKIMMKLKEQPGAIFKPTDFSADEQTMRDMYGSKGYLDSQQRGTTLIEATHSANPITGTMDLAYDIHEGDKNYIERVIIKGNVKTKDRVLRRELAVFPGEVYDMVRVKISKQRLEGMDYFSKVDAQAQDSDVPNAKDLVVGVEEKSTGSFTLGAGFSTVESIVGTVEVRQGNFDLFNSPTFTGAGQKLQLRLSIGTLLQDYDLNFIEPWFLGKRLIFSVDLFHREVYYNALHDDYVETFDGGTVSLTKALFGLQALKGTVSYTLQNVHVSIPSGYETFPTTDYSTGVPVVTPPQVSTNIMAERGTYFESIPAVALEYDTRNNLRMADSGQDSSIKISAATPPGDVEFYKVEMRTDWYFKGFGKGHIFEVVGKAGWVTPWGNTTHIPIFDRYFLGGMYSLRGYRYETVGPLDDMGEALGGDTDWFASAEYSIPLLRNSNMIRYAFFYDIGNVYPGSLSFKPAPGDQFYNDDVGIGLRIVLPIGGGTPLRLDYGVPIEHGPTASRFGKFQFGIGYSRQF